MRELTLAAVGLMALAGAAGAQGTSPAPPNADAGSIAGAGVGGALAAGQQPGLFTVLRPSVLVPLLGLAALALAPVAWRYWRARHG